MNAPILLNIPADGPVILPLEPLRRAGFVPGDQIVLSIAAPGHLYLHKADVLPTGPDLKNSLRRLIQNAFEQQGIYGGVP
jgi:hypothetical protein